MSRYFVAIAIPRPVRDHLALLRANLPDARWVAPEDYHLTLRYIGDCDGPTCHHLIDALEQIELDSFSLQPKGVGTFGHDKPRAIWVGVDNNPHLFQLQQNVDAAVRQAGIATDGRRFTPHITLARLSRSKPDRVARALDGIGNPVIPAFHVDAFALFTSGRFRGGGPYICEATFALNTSLSPDPIAEQKEHR